MVDANRGGCGIEECMRCAGRLAAPSRLANVNQNPLRKTVRAGFAKSFSTESADSNHSIASAVSPHPASSSLPRQFTP